MPREERNRLDYIVVCVSEFASHYGMKPQEAYAYLRKHKGIDFLQEFYDVEHTLSFEEMVNDLSVICKKNGGAAI